MSDVKCGGLQPRVRHVASIQVRNFTPFPTRDAAASALTQPAERPQFTPHGQLLDDSDVVLSRRRSRRISINSVNSMKTFKSDAGGDGPVGAGIVSETRGRKPMKGLKAGPPLGTSSGSGGLEVESSRHKNVSGSAPTIRARRQRTTSTVSASSVTALGPAGSSAILPFSGSLSGMAPDNSQVGLERVIHSRLVESFIAVTVPPLPPAHETNVPSTPVASSSRSSTPLASPPPMKDRSRSMSKQGKLTNGVSVKKDAKTAPASTRLVDPSSSPRPSPKSPSSHSAIHPNGKVSISSHHKSSSTASNYRMHNSPAPIPPRVATIPNYLSEIHRPSTNPVFYLDNLADWTDTSATKLSVQIWAKLGDASIINSTAGRKVKGKEKQRDETESTLDWKVLQEWDIDLNDLVPLPSELAENSELFPPNTVVLHLSPPDQYFSIPLTPTPRERSSSPSVAYNSDPELEVRKSKQPTDFRQFSDLTPHSPNDIITHSRRRHRKAPGRTDDSTDELAKTASWQDLFKLVSLQSTLADTEISLNNIISNIDRSMESTESLARLTREASEQEAWVGGLKANCIYLKTKSNEFRERILARRQALEERRNILSTARDQLNDDIITYSDTAMEVTEEEHRLVSLRAQLHPIRTSLISTLASIFPIELLSPPDLLYTIADVPLPIPLTNTDPAPPLSLPNHKDINEDVVATALGYSAQVVQLLAAYLGKGLVYPITCIGSRSLVRDGISGMVGPRMFPLFSRGVDTYRFEYGVFLLNKNIEMLMVDRELRPVDMRHTLPNLKNLLLTLTSYEEPAVRVIHRPPSSVMSISSLESPRPESPQLSEADATTSNGVTTPKASKLADLPPENTTPPASGASTPTTPTAPPDSERKARSSYLSLAPFSSFLRSRLPSTTLTKPTAKEVLDRESLSDVEDASSSGHSTSSNDEDGDGIVHHEQPADEEDRKTIRGVPLGLGINGDVSHGLSKEDSSRTEGAESRSNEKTDNLAPFAAPPTPQPPQPV